MANIMKGVALAASFFYIQEVICYRNYTNHSHAYDERKINRSMPFGKN